MKSGIFNLLKCNSRKLIDLPKYNQTPSPHCFQFEIFSAATPLSTSWNGYKPLCCPSLLHFGALHENEQIRKKITHRYILISALLQKTWTTDVRYLLVERKGRDGSKNLPILPYHGKGVVWKSTKDFNSSEPVLGSSSVAFTSLLAILLIIHIVAMGGK